MPGAPELDVHELPEDRIGDAREEEAWFRRLPDHAKNDLRKRWRTEEQRLEKIQLRWNERTRRYLLEGVGLLVLFDFIFGWGTPLTCGVAAAVGAAMGLGCAATRAGRELYTLFGVLAHCLLGFIAYPFPFHFGLIVYVFYVVLCALLGFSHEFRRWDASEI